MNSFGRYQIVSLLGQGGMSLVYKAWCPRLKAMVALKVVSPAPFEEGRMLGLLQRDAWFAGRLRHSHIVPVYETGEADGCLYTVMQYCSGGSLDDSLRGGREVLPLQAACTIVQQIGSALQYAHSLGVVHGDVKPSNILFDGSGRAMLSDFGIAQLVGETALGGTPGYAAPEQAKGHMVDARADVYALGAVLLATLAGQHVLLGTHALRTSLPSHVPSSIGDILARAMAHDPNMRPSSVRDFLYALACW